MNQIIKKKGVNFGLILGFLFALLTSYSYGVDHSLFGSIWVLVFVFLLVIILGIIAIASSKKAQKGFITFKEAFTTYFLMVIIGMAISTALSIVLFNFIDPDFKQVIVEQQIKAIDGQEEYWLNKMGDAPQEQVDELIEKFDEAREDARTKDSYAIGEQVKGLFMGTAIFSLFGLLLALILKKKDPSLE